MVGTHQEAGVLQFDQAQHPKFEERKGKGYVEFGINNDYPKYLLGLYNESPKHGAIVKSKCNYIYGKGFEDKSIANSKGETWNNILRRCIKDDELYRGYFLQIIWNRVKKVSEIYHIEFHKVRVSKDLQKFYVKNDWNDIREKPREYDAFNLNNPFGSQIFYYKEYNPSSETYPLPVYFQGLNYIESDIEVSRHILGMAKQSFVGSTLINLNNGDPINEEHKGEVERGLLKKFTGDSGKRVVIMFNKSKENSAEILPLATTTLTKEDFTNVNNLIQQEIFASHQIVSPTLFGIKTEGQLGARNEIRDAYEIFNNVYCSERQLLLDEIFTKFWNLSGHMGELKIQPVEPLKFEFTENIMVANLTQDEIRKLMGKEPLIANQVTSDGKVAPAPAPVTTPMQSNDAIKNLSGRQYQNVMRIVRQFSNGKLKKEQATLMLKNGFGFSDADVNTFLGIDDSPITDFEIQKFSSNQDDLISDEFSKVGDNKNDFFFIHSKGIEDNFAKELNQTEADVLSLLTKEHGNITPEDISKTLKIDLPIINQIIKGFIDSEIIKSVASKINENPKYEVLKPVSELGGKDAKVTKVFIRYSYEWRDIVPLQNRNINTSRPFCQKMYSLSENKMWSRADIENISMRLGYSVFDRCGGWWGNSVQCRHQWVSHLVTKKED